VAPVTKLNRAINVALADPKIRAQLDDLGGAVLAGSPADFGKLIADDTEKWGKAIRRQTSRQSDPLDIPYFRPAICVRKRVSKRQ